MSVPELKALARKHWTKYRPKMVQELKAEGNLEMALHGAAALAQDQIDHLMRQGYYEHEAREVALRDHILLPGEEEDDEQAQELAEKEAEYRRKVVPYLP
jgi:hypothetical protein